MPINIKPIKMRFTLTGLSVDVNTHNVWIIIADRAAKIAMKKDEFVVIFLIISTVKINMEQMDETKKPMFKTSGF